ncbi:uncharacterized protein KGF55_004160 [Candida pseudojiufengensis]|uniref:uncharacterized protein n=1 Tax=Candida pseudojiufengensis TaxID=497109 RepID=UPI002225A647|nr:uncharacterized protein KGF55_004160 [Candida pseudojiufengensis]KAI5961235.1 hypothetical protein KGF55_004160 [Candida pseudojiufengensis]
MSIISNRVALSTIRDNQLNSSKSTTPNKNNLFKQRRYPDILTKSFSIEKSGTYYGSDYRDVDETKATKSVSFNDYGYESTEKSPTLHSNSSNDVAGLAATKLKLKLQLALYKLKQNKKKVNNKKSISSKTILSPINSKKSTPNSSPNIESIYHQSILSSLPTPPEQPKYYTKSINVNLQYKNKPEVSATSLSKVANNKFKKQNGQQKLKLFQIKKDSIYYSDNTKKLPLIRKKQQIEPSFKMDSFINNFIYQPSLTTLPSISNQKINSELQLPPINKILKTPIKQANLSFTNASRIPTTVDDTIDDDQDMTLLQNSTYQNSTLHDTTKDNDETKLQEEEEEDSEDSDDEDKIEKTVLTSSPFNNHLGTPNSFSVAKSLLQLGGHRM